MILVLAIVLIAVVLAIGWAMIKQSILCIIDNFAAKMCDMPE